MKQAHLIVFIAAVVIIGGAGVYVAQRDAANDAVEAGSLADDAAAGPGEAAVGPAPSAADETPPLGPGVGGGSWNLQRDQRDQIAIGDPPYEPKNAAEVAWLNRHRYPSAAVLDAALKEPAVLSQVDRKDGISAKEIIQTEQAAIRDPGAVQEATSILNQAAASGSTYALHALGLVYSHPHVNSPAQAEAYFRAMGLLGDWNSHLRVKTPLSAQDDMLASIMAHQVVANLNRLRRQNGLPPLGNDPRPGLDDFLSRVNEAKEATGG